MDYALWLLSNGVYKPMDLDIDVIGNNNDTFSSHWREKAYKLTEGKVNRGMNAIREDDPSI